MMLRDHIRRLTKSTLPLLGARREPLSRRMMWTLPILCFVRPNGRITRAGRAL
jgi:hypothetical protein